VKAVADSEVPIFDGRMLNNGSIDELRFEIRRDLLVERARSARSEAIAFSRSG
jgi:hypothetical protein